MTRALVSGANGFAGSALCRRLAQEGLRVVALVRATSDLSLLADVPCERVTGSLEDAASLRAATRGVDLIFHAAANVSDWGTLAEHRRVNVEGTRRLLAAAVENGVRRFVYVSSVAVHSFIDVRNMDENSPQLPTPFAYCQSKREAEALVQAAHQAGAIETVIIRPGDLYGPGDRVVLLRMGGLLRCGLMAHIGGGNKLGAFTGVENLAHALLLAGTLPQAAGQAYVITDGVQMSWREYFRQLTAALGYPEPRLSIHPRLAYALASLLEGIWRQLRLKSRPPVTRYLVTHLSNDFHFSIAKAQLRSSVRMRKAHCRDCSPHRLPAPPFWRASSWR